MPSERQEKKTSDAEFTVRDVRSHDLELQNGYLQYDLNNAKQSLEAERERSKKEILEERKKAISWRNTGVYNGS